MPPAATSKSKSASSPSSPALRRHVARHRVRERLEEMILSGRCRAGSKLVQQDLARQLGVARGVVREAMFELRPTGLVEAIDNRGMYVVPMSKKRLMDGYEVREMNEGLAARLCCRRITREQLDELRAMAREIHRLAKSGREKEGAQIDRAFHRRIMEIANNEELLRMARQFAVLGKHVQIKSDCDLTLAGHLKILDAIASNDPEHAEQVMREQIRVGRDTVAGAIADRSFKPRWLV